MIKELIKLANELDNNGLVREADYLDKIIKSANNNLMSDQKAVNELLNMVRNAARSGHPTFDPGNIRSMLGRMHPEQIGKLPALISAAATGAGAKAAAARSMVSMIMSMVSVEAGYYAGAMSASSVASSAAVGTATAAIAAGATLAAVLSLFGGLAFMTFYPLEKLKTIEGKLENSARINGRPVVFGDFNGDTKSSIMEYLTGAIWAMQDGDSEANELIRALLNKEVRSGGSGESIKVIDYRIMEEAKDEVDRMKARGERQAEELRSA